MKIIRYLFLTICLITGMIALQYQPSLAEDYFVGSQDVLRITVYDHPDLTTIVRVSEGGKITFPFIGELEVKNLSVQQIENGIAKILSAGYIKNPQVTVFIEQYRGQKVTIMGEVAKPGQYEMTGSMYLIDAISMALGLTKEAGDTITVLRKNQTDADRTDQQKLSIDVERLFKDGDLAQNIQLRDKDVIYIPRISFFYIYGEVSRPGLYRIENNLTVKRAIAIAGGFTQKASKNKIEVTRRQDGKDVIIRGTINDTVNRDDVLMIKESIF
ncbi:MAG: SLBB domain-containing protein [Nitrospirae bacterium]|nr:SLBB domain-containing protein [Nitrospirota bacterium]